MEKVSNRSANVKDINGYVVDLMEDNVVVGQIRVEEKSRYYADDVAENGVRWQRITFISIAKKKHGFRS
mgnify:CR=1 FL=1